MPRERIFADHIEEAVRKIMFYLNVEQPPVQKIIPYYGNTTINTEHKAVYFDGWGGLAASAVLRAIAENPPQSLVKEFNKIIHVDCSIWKSRRALQRKLAQELKLPHHVMAAIDRQDEEDDFSGINESSRAEIKGVGADIHRVLLQEKCLVVCLNGSDETIDLDDFGIPLSVWGTRVLWTFRGRLRLNSDIGEKVDNSHLYLYKERSLRGWEYLLKIEAREIAGYTDMLADTVEECCLYMLSLNSKGGDIMDYNWATHASSYWVCDGIIQGVQSDEAWEVATALHQQICMDDYSSNTLPSFASGLNTRPNRWILFRDNCVVHGRTTEGSVVVHPESTSFFLAALRSGSDPPLRLLHNDMFQQSDKLRVLKLCGCTFSFSSPPFHCCRNLRFLGLHGCKDQQVDQTDNHDRPTMEFFKSLWVLDICYTNWELDLSPETVQQMAANIREVHINNGRFWNMTFAWKQLHNLHKLRVINPTCSWDMGGKDEFTVLPSLPASNSLKTLVLGGCVGLEHVEGLPLSLESFSLDAGSRKNDYKEAKIRRISMAGCARLSYFTLHGSLPNLNELDLSGTKLKILDLRAEVVQIPCLQRVMLFGCEQLRAVLWLEKDLPQLNLLCIDTRGGEVFRGILHNYKGYCQAYVTVMDMRFLHSFVRKYGGIYWYKDRFSLNIRILATSTNGEHSCDKEKMGSESSGKILGPPVPKSLIQKHSCSTYTGVVIGDIIIDHDYNTALQFKPSRYHVEIGEGISNTCVESIQGFKAIIVVMDRTESLHVHDNSSIMTVIPEYMMSIDYNEELRWQHLKQCHVVRCPKMQTVFITNYHAGRFHKIETFWAADLPMARCIWNLGELTSWNDYFSFAELRSIHLYSCPRLTFVLPLSWHTLGTYLPNLETLYIVNCGALVKVFPVKPRFLEEIATDGRKGVLRFPKLKHIYLHELYKLQQICEARMFAHMLETVRLTSRKREISPGPRWTLVPGWHPGLRPRD